MDKIYSDEDILKLKRIVIVIMNCKRHHQKLNRYEYYMLGGIPFKGSEKILRKLLAKNKISLFEFNVLYKYIENELVFGASRNKEFILKTHYQFGNRIITDEEKQSIWLELNAMGLADNDIDDLVFSGAIRQFAKENGLIPMKKKLIRK